jgi:hypothetical protein
MNTQREKMLFWLIIYCYLFVKLVSAEVITLINDSNVTCVITENSIAYYSTSPDIIGKFFYFILCQISIFYVISLNPGKRKKRPDAG